MIKNFTYVGSTILGYRLVENNNFGKRVTNNNINIDKKKESVKTLRKRINRRNIRNN